MATACAYRGAAGSRGEAPPQREQGGTSRGQEKRAGREEAGLETHSGLGAPTPVPPGMRPAPLSEVARPPRCVAPRWELRRWPCQCWQPTTRSTTEPSRSSCRARYRRGRRKRSSGGGERWSKGGEVVDTLVFFLLGAAGQGGFIEPATAQAEVAYGGDFVFLASYLGRFAMGGDVTFSARQGPTGLWEASDLADW